MKINFLFIKFFPKNFFGNIIDYFFIRFFILVDHILLFFYNKINIFYNNKFLIFVFWVIKNIKHFYNNKFLIKEKINKDYFVLFLILSFQVLFIYFFIINLFKL